VKKTEAEDDRIFKPPESPHSQAGAETDCLRKLFLGWESEKVASLILKTRPHHFERLRWFLSSAIMLCPEWPIAVGHAVPWQLFHARFETVQKGDLRSLLETFEVFLGLGNKLGRSLLRQVTESMGKIFTGATLDDLRIPQSDRTLLNLTLFFPDDTRAAFSKLDPCIIGEATSHSLPRHWVMLEALSGWAGQCDSNIAECIINACDVGRLEQQARRFGPSNRYEFRLLLHFLSYSPQESRQALGGRFYHIVRETCVPNNSEAPAVMAAYARIDREAAARLANEIGVAPEYPKDPQGNNDLEEIRKQFRDRDRKEGDYEISFTDDSPHQARNT
jgi:hypothetical protein